MRMILLLGPALLGLAANSQPAAKAPCAAKPFALAKPTPPPAKPVSKPAPVKVASKPAKPLADCKTKPPAG